MLGLDNKDIQARTYFGIQSRRQSLPDVFVTKGPCSKIEDCIIRISLDFLQKLPYTFSFRWKVTVDIGFDGESSVKIDLVESFLSKCIWDEDRVPDKAVHPPSLSCLR